MGRGKEQDLGEKERRQQDGEEKGRAECGASLVKAELIREELALDGRGQGGESEKTYDQNEVRHREGE